MESSFRNLWCEKEMRSVESKEAGEFFHINGGYWKTPNLNSIRIGTFYYSPPFECVRNIWQLSLFSLGFDADLDLHFEIRLSHLRGIFNAEKIRIGIAGDEGEFLTCDEFCPPFEFPLFHVIRLIFPSVSDRGYEEGLRIFMKINSRDHLEAESFNQSKVRIGRRKSSQKNQICFEVSTQTEDDIAGNEKYNVKNKAACLDTSVENKNESGMVTLHHNLRKFPNRNENDKIDHGVEKNTGRVLTADSPWYNTMVMEEIVEMKINALGIPSIKISSLFKFLTYLRIGTIEKLEENALELYKAADNFGIEQLKEICKKHILKNISVENFFGVFSLSLSVKDREIKDSCLLFFALNFHFMYASSEWRTFKKENGRASEELLVKCLEIREQHKKYMV